MSSAALQVMDQMMDAWQNQDWDAVTALFTPQGSLEIVPIGATYTGHPQIRGHLDEVAGGIESLHFNVKHLLDHNGLVTFERDDVFIYNGREGIVPCVGILQIEDNQVACWREYFDGMTMAKALGMK